MRNNIEKIGKDIIISKVKLTRERRTLYPAKSRVFLFIGAVVYFILP